MDDAVLAASPAGNGLPTTVPPATNAVTVATTAVADDDESEWEYEYSATETETHLITLDLSIPEFVRRRDEFVVHNTRGGFRSWLNPLNMDDARPATSLAGGGAGGDGGEDEGDGEGEGEGEGGLAEDSDRDDDAPNPSNGNAAANPNTKPPAPADEPDPTEIQILELHAAEPVIAYRGMLFRGAWAETIGTEMLFAGTGGDAARSGGVDDGGDGQPPLPLPTAVRLSKEVDLVGASSARIACTPTEMRARKGNNATEDAEGGTTTNGGRKKKRLGFVIPVGNGASAQRQQQAAFLEQLMAIKHGRGEADVVTVQAVDTRANAVHDDADETKRRAQRATQSQVYQQRRATKRQRRLGEGEGDEPAAAATSTTATSTTMAGRPPGRRPSRRGRKKALSQIARVTGDDRLVDSEKGKGEEAEGEVEGDMSTSEGNDSDASGEPRAV